MDKKELKKYKQYQKCYDSYNRHHRCVYCNEILDHLRVFNLDSGEEALPFGNFLVVKHGTIYHEYDENDNEDFEDIHRIDYEGI